MEFNPDHSLSSPKQVSCKIEEGLINISDVLDSAIDSGASDVHLSANENIAFRINGSMVFVTNIDPLTREDAQRIIFEMIPSEDQRDTIIRTREMDLAYHHVDGTAIRVNVFFKQGNIACVLRIISRNSRTMTDLGIPESVIRLADKKQGLLLVTGPTGSGKSTSMQAILEHINETRVEHILTIEDPVEFLFTSKKSVFSQREVGFDTLSFTNALRAALREDPDVVMIGEMRDPETIAAALSLAETGHLVLSTMHTSGAPQTITRIINAFPPNQHEQISQRLSDSLIGILSQRLVLRSDKPKRTAVYEVLIVNAPIRNILRSREMGQMDNAMHSGRSVGMIRMQDYAEALFDQEVIDAETYKHFLPEE